MIRIFISVLLSMGMIYSVSSYGNTPESDMHVDQTTRSEVINKMIKDISDYYVFPDIGKLIESAIKKHITEKKYDKINSASELAKQLTSDLQEISHDKHLQIIYSYEILPKKEKRESISEELKSIPLAKSSVNFGFEQVRRLNGNVGYLSFKAL